MARIAMGGFLHETNCFVPMRTDYAYYARGGDFPPLARGAEIVERTAGSSYGMSGFLEVMQGRHELVPLIWGHAGAGGYVTDDAFERIVGELVGGLSRAMPVDAVYLDLHGAMCTETYADAESELLRRLRGIDADIYDRSVDMLISRLRKKLGDDSRSPRFIKTIWRTGYQFVAAPDAREAPGE